MTSRIICVLIVSTLWVGCNTKEETRFKLIPSTDSGISFNNQLIENVDFNIFNYMYFYNGAGVTVGDLNQDHLPDIFFTSNQGSNKLYINQGNFKFLDVTEEANLAPIAGWATGATMADVNGDGLLDIYVSYVGGYLSFTGTNKLFINEGVNVTGIPTFSEQSRDFGLDLSGLGTQASFFDYDRDGDLDMFMLNHSLHQNGTFAEAKNLRYKSHPTAGDKLLRNDNGKFVDVTAASGIYQSALGYGLGIVISDVNLDGWLDIYIGNDFHENDYLYINQGDGTFRESLEQQMNHTSRYTMGVDLADFNNDAFPDLIAMDMLPGDYQRLKSSAAEDGYDTYQFKASFGYNEQYTRNTLQLNNQDGTFSEIGLLAGVAATDWSWSSFFADFDLDGNKDIFISNGILRRSNDLDYINFISSDSIQRKMNGPINLKQLSYIEEMPQVKIQNYVFVNNGDSTFTDKATDWGFQQSSYSNGSAYADFDNDGDLDLVVNNVNDNAFLYENRTIHPTNQAEAPGFLQITLKSDSSTTKEIGAKVLVYTGNSIQMQEKIATRGYLSSVDTRMIFGLGKKQIVDSILVVWTDGSYQRLDKVKASQFITIEKNSDGRKFDYSRFQSKSRMFQKDSLSGVSYVHRENNYIEFDREALLPHMISAEGPAMSVGDINGDGREDIFLGGAKWQQAAVYLQLPNGKFSLSKQPMISADSTYEDVESVFFDADKDNDLDLFVVTGGNEFAGKSELMKSRLYLNNGKGLFDKKANLPDVYQTGSAVAVSDFDRDGDQDIFLGARSVPWKYGVVPDSYILQNNGNGVFEDVTKTKAPQLLKFGFVNDAKWLDMDKDGDEDLIIAAEWSPIVWFVNENGKLRKQTLVGVEKKLGWWNEIIGDDFDKDGDLDLIVGNLGLNSKLRASEQQPVRMYYSDFDSNGTSEQILTHYVDGIEYPFNTRDEMVKQMPSLKKKYLSYRRFSEARFQEFFSSEVLNKAQVFEATCFESAYFQNNGESGFTMIPLPKAAQFSSVNTMMAEDFNGDGNLDVLAAGNFYRSNIQMGRYDASFGHLLVGNGKGGFRCLPQSASGISLKGEARVIAPILIENKRRYIVARNNETIELLKPNH